MGKCLLAPLLLIVLLAEASLCVEVDFGGRPARPVEEEGKFSYSKIFKFSNFQILVLIENGKMRLCFRLKFKTSV